MTTIARLSLKHSIEILFTFHSHILTFLKNKAMYCVIFFSKYVGYFLINIEMFTSRCYLLVALYERIHC